MTFRFRKEVSKMELWKDIPGYEGIYEVSDTGRVMVRRRINALCTTTGEGQEL